MDQNVIRKILIGDQPYEIDAKYWGGGRTKR